ncbi:mucin-16 [Spodoptera frugiperda]|uniref:Mucin-16 n=1 Tax=Spodoptera frugiperda TaxID=7108 RepID=A0A9R0DNL8_SPOFR|nr:mucin-16 [Spodoptera frugiperda]
MFRTKEVIPNLCNESENRDDENDKAINLNLTDNHKAKNVVRPQIIDVNQNGDGQNINHKPDKSTNVDMDYDSSDEGQSKALNFSDSDLPDSPEIEAYVASFQKEANTECQFSESEQGNSSDTEEFNPFVFRKKKSKPVSTVTANLNTLPSRVSTRYRKPFIENATAHILKPTYLTEQEPEIDADIVAENIKRLRIYNEFKDVSNRINQNVSQNKTHVRNNKPKEVLTTISGTEIEASSILASTTINRLTRSDSKITAHKPFELACTRFQQEINSSIDKRKESSRSPELVSLRIPQEGLEQVLNSSKPAQISLQEPPTRVSTSSDPVTSTKGPQKTKTRQSIPNDSQQDVTTFRITRSRLKGTPKQVSKPAETTVTEVSPLNSAKQVFTSSDSAATSDTSKPTQNNQQEPSKPVSTSSDSETLRKVPQEITNIQSIPNDSQQEVTTFRITRSRSKETPKQISKLTETIVTQISPLNLAKQVLISSDSAATLNASKPTQDSQQEPQTRVSTSSDPETSRKRSEKTKNRQSIPNDSQQEVTTFRITRSRSKESLKQVSKPTETIVPLVRPPNSAKLVLTSFDSAATSNTSKPTQDSLQEPSTRVSTSSDPKTSRKGPQKTYTKENRQSIQNDSQQEDTTLFRITRSRLKDTPKVVLKPAETIVTPRNSAKQALTSSDSAAALNIFKPTQELSTRVSTSSDASTRVSTSSDSWTQESASSDSETSRKRSEKTKSRQSIPNESQQEATLLRITRSKSKQTPKQVSKPAETLSTEVSPQNSAEQLLTSSDSVTTWGTSQEPPKRTEIPITRSKPRIMSLTQVSRSSGDELEVSGSREYPKQISKPTEAIVTEVKPPNSAKQALTTSDSAATLNIFKPTQELATRVSTSSNPSTGVSTSSDPVTSSKGPEEIKTRQSVPYDFQQKVTTSSSKQSLKQLSAETIVTQVRPPNSAEQIFKSSDSAAALNTFKPTQNSQQEPSTRMLTPSDPKTSRKEPEKTTSRQTIPNDSQQEVTTFRITRSRSKDTPKQVSKPTEAIVTEVKSPNSAEQALTSSDSAATSHTSQPTQDSLQEPSKRVSILSDPETSTKGPEKTKNRQSIPNDPQQEDTTLFRITLSRLKETPKVVLKPAETIVTPRNSAKQALTSSDSAAALNIFKPTQEPSTRVSTSSDASTRVSTSSDSWTQESTSSDSETSRKRSEKTKSRQNIPNDSQQEATLLRITRSKSKQTPKQVSQPPETISTEVSPQNSAEQVFTSSDSVTILNTSREPSISTDTLITRSKPRIMSLTQVSKSPGDELEVSGSREYPKQISKPTEAIVTEVKRLNSAEQALTSYVSAATMNTSKPTEDSLSSKRVSTSSDPETSRRGPQKTKTRQSIPNDSQQEVTSKPAQDNIQDPSKRVSTSSDPETSRRGPQKTTNQQSIPNDSQQEVTTLFRITRSRSKETPKQVSKPAETTVTQVRPPNSAEQVFTSSDSAGTWGTSQEPPKPTETLITRNKPRITSLTQVSKSPGDELEVSGSREYPKQISKPTETIVTEVRPPNSAEQVFTSSDSAAALNTSKPTEDSLSSKRLSTSSDPKTSRKGPKKTKKRQSIPNDSQQEVISKPTQDNLQDPSKRVSTSSDPETSRRRPQKTTNKQSIPNDSQQEVTTLFRITRSRSKETPKVVLKPAETIVTPLNSAKQALTSSDSAAALNIFKPKQEPSTRVSTSSDASTRVSTSSDSWTQESTSSDSETSRKRSEKTKSRQNIPNDSQQEATLLRITRNKSKQTPKQVSQPPETISTQVRTQNSAEQILTSRLQKPVVTQIGPKKTVATQIEPEKTVATKSRSQKTEVTQIGPEKTVATQIEPEKTVVTEIGPEKTVVTESRPQKPVVTQIGPEKTVATQIEPEKTVATKSRSQKTEVTQIGLEKTVATQIEPEKTVVTTSRSQKTEVTQIGPEKTVVTQIGPEKTVVTQIGPEKTVATQIEPEKTVVTKIGPEKTVATQIEPEKTVVTKSRSQKTEVTQIEPEKSIATQIGPEKSVVTESRPQKPVVTQIGPEKTVVTQIGPEKTVATQIGPEKTVAPKSRSQKTKVTQIGPEKTVVTQIGPEKTVASKSRSQKTVGTKMRPQKTVVTQIGPEKTEVTESRPLKPVVTQIGPEKTVVTQIRPQKPRITQIGPEKTVVTQIGPEKTVVTQIGTEKTVATQIRPQKTEVTESKPHKPVVTEIEPEETVATKSRSQKTEVTQIGPEKTVATQIEPEKTVVTESRPQKPVFTQIGPEKTVATQIGPEKTVVTKSRSQKTEVTQIGPEKTVASKSRPQKALVTQNKLQKAVVIRSKPQKTIATRRRLQKTVITQNKPQQTRSRKIPSSPKAYLIKRQRKHPEKIEESTVKTSESVLKYSSQKQSLVSDTSSNATSPRSLKRSLRSSDAPSAKRTRVLTTCSTQEKTSATQIEPEKTVATKSRSQKTEVTKSEPQKTVVTKNRPQKPLVRQNKIQKAVVTRSKPQKTIATRRRLNKPQQTRSRKIPSSPKTHLVKRLRKHPEKIEESTVKASKSVLKYSSQKQSSVSDTSSNTTSPRSLKRSLRSSDVPSAKRTRVLKPSIASNKITTRRR